VGHQLVFSSITNLFQTIVGSGILALPYAFLDGGAGLGILNMAIMGVLSALGFLAIGHTCHSTGARTYREAWQRTVGRYEGIVDVVILFECSITMVSFMILIIDYLGVIGDTLLSLPNNRAISALVVTVPVLVPLSLQPQLTNLRFSSFFGNCAVTYIVTYVIMECVGWNVSIALEHLGEAGFLGRERRGIFRATSMMASAYIAHYNAPFIYAELASHPKQWQGFVTSAVVSFSGATMAYGTFALAGFARFGSAVQGNLLLNYGRSGTILAAWIGMTITLTVSFPLQVKPARDAFAQCTGIELYKGPEDSKVNRVPFVICTLALVTVVVTWGVLMADISWVLAFRGSLLAFPVSFSMPGLMLMNCPVPAESSSRRRSIQTVSGWLLLVCGIANSILGLYCAIIEKF
jgi:amino acid permease